MVFFEAWHTFISNFDRISINYLMEYVIFRETCVNYSQELGPYVCCNIFRIGGVEPGNVSVSVSSFRQQVTAELLLSRHVYKTQLLNDEHNFC